MDLTQILVLRYGNHQWHLIGNDYENLNWLSDTPKPSLKELEAHWPSVQKEIVQIEIDRKTKRQAILDRLGITEDEARLLLS